MFSNHNKYDWLRETAGFWKQYMKLCAELESLVETPIVISDLSRKSQKIGKHTHWHWFLSLEQKTLHKYRVSPNVVLTAEKIPHSIYVNFVNDIQYVCSGCGAYKGKNNLLNLKTVYS